jgi:DNA replication licensing factor MCM3
MENIGLPASLLSRFDLLFIVLDCHDPRIDATVADHVLRTHRWRGHAVEANSGVFVQADPLLHGTDEEDFLTLAFLRKFVAYVREARPALSEAAKNEIVQAWAELRTVEGRKALPLTPRAFETLIRLATAHAKIRMAQEVGEEDARVAIGLLRYAIFGEAAAPERRRVGRRRPEVESDASEGERREDPADAGEAPEEEKGAAAHVVEANIGKLMEVFQMLLKDPHVTTVPVPELVERTEREKGFRPSEEEVALFLNRLVRADKIMLDENIIYPL